MSGILKEVLYLKGFAIENMFHPINMIFIKNENETEIYPYQTSLENQFCSQEEKIDGLLDKIAAEKLAMLESCIGKKYDVNLYKFSVSELTDGKYVALHDVDSYEDDAIIREFRRATYKTREDLFIQLKFNICLSGMNARFVGITKDGKEEEIDNTLIFQPNNEEPKNYTIPYEGFPEVTEYFIINEMPLEIIENGQFLATSLKYHNIKFFNGSSLISRLKKYREYVREINTRNSSIRKLIAFWEPKETVEPFDPTKGTIIECDRNTVLDFFKDCYILSKTYPKDCIKAKEEYYKEIEDRLRKKYNYETEDENRVKDKLKEILKEQSSRYKGKVKIKILD
jgi:hypothetical protein